MGSGSASSKPMATNGQADAGQVKSLQKALQEKGMDPGPIDGIMGPRTQQALRDYQKGQSLPETGRLDAQTREKLGVTN
jgi:peptidoglycan hydrolase-like protein with peptidoglycan-binding domain